jgi:hypothetical protein
LVSHHQSMHCGPPNSPMASSLVKRSMAVQRQAGATCQSSIRRIRSPGIPVSAAAASGMTQPRRSRPSSQRVCGT